MVILNFKPPMFLAILAITILFQACQNDDSEILSSDDQLIMDYLEKINVPTENIDLNSDFIGYHDCSGWHREDLLNEINSLESLESQDIFQAISDDDLSGNELETRQQGILRDRRWDALTANNVQNIDYFIRPSVAADCGAAWRQATIDAANAWNNLANTRVNFRRVWNASAADIVIGSDEDPSMPNSHTGLDDDPDGGWTVARAGFPSGGRAFRWISINDFILSRNWQSKLKTMMHEFGHCLGYRHTGTGDGERIPGTPANDANSIMNQGVNTNPAWTANDERSIRMYYPQRLDMPTNVNITSPARGRAVIRFSNPSNTARPYYWVRILRYSNTGNYLDSRWMSSPANGIVTHAWTGLPSGPTRFQIEAFNLRRDVKSPRTATVTVTVQ